MLHYLKQLISGRVNRLTYLYSFVIITLSPWIFVYIPFIVATHGSELPYAYILLVTIPFIVWQLSLAIRRFHDIGHHGIEIILLFIPFVNIFYFYWLFFKKGQDKDNIHGTKLQKGIDETAPYLLSKRNMLLLPLFLLLISAIYANIVPRNKTTDASASHQKQFILTNPQPNAVLCLGKHSALSWEAPNDFGNFFIFLYAPDGTKSTINYTYNNSEIQYYAFAAKEYKGSTIWHVGDVVEQGKNAPSILKPGSGYIFQLTSVNSIEEKKILSDPFTIKDCGL